MPYPNKGGYEMPSRAISEVILLGNLSSIRLSGPFSRNVSKEKGEKKRAKSGSGGYLWQSKDQKHLRTGTAVHLLGQGCPLLVSHKYVCNNIFTRPSDTTRLLARLVRLGHPFGYRPPVPTAGPTVCV